MCERAKRRREETLFEVEMERLRVVLLEKRQRLKLEAMTAVSGLFSGPAADEGVMELLTSVAKEVLGAHVEGQQECSDTESDPDYHPGAPELEPCADEQLQQYNPAGPVRAEIPSVMLFFSALSNDRPAPREMLASDLYTSYKQFCVGRQNCCDDEDMLIQARNSFGMLLRTINGVQKQTSAGGTRYTFDWRAIVKHLRATGVYCGDVRLC